MEVDHEQEIVKAFFTPGRRARYLGLLSTPRGRRKFISSLPHLDALDTRFVRRLDPQEQDVDVIEALLKERGAPATCYVVSQNFRLDLREMELLQALQATVGFGLGTFLSYMPGQLAYFEGEDPGARYICERRNPTG